MELESNHFPNKKGILEFVDACKCIFFPEFFFNLCCEKDCIEKAKILYKEYVCDEEKNVKDFFSYVPKLKEYFTKDIETTFQSDPACDSLEEVIASYPGFTATFYHRIAHIIYKEGLKVVARIISEEAHFLTGIDIHPGATIGEYFFIDHGTGIVIGETTTIGNHCKIYQGVTLGALSLSDGQKLRGVKRHPTIGNHVTIYSGASILGGEAIIGDHVVIGSNVFLTESIPEYTRVTITKPTLVVMKRTKK